MQYLIKLKLNKKEKNLLKILAFMIVILISNLFIIKPIDIKVRELEIKKQDILDAKKQIDLENKPNLHGEEDIILKIEKDIKQFINIEYIDKKVVWNENSNDEINIEIKVNGSLEQVFRMEDSIKKLDLSEQIKYIEINKIKNISDEEENQEEKVECIMALKVV